MHSYRYILKIVQVPQHWNYIRVVILVYWVHTRNIFFILVYETILGQHFFSTSENLGESILCRIYVYSTTITIRIWTYSGIQRRHIGQKTKVVAALLLVKRKFKVFPHKKHQGPCNDCWHVECCPRTLLDGRYVIMIREGPLLPPQRQIQPWVVDVLGCILIKVFFSLCVWLCLTAQIIAAMPLQYTKS